MKWLKIQIFIPLVLSLHSGKSKMQKDDVFYSFLPKSVPLK